MNVYRKACRCHPAATVAHPNHRWCDSDSSQSLGNGHPNHPKSSQIIPNHHRFGNTSPIPHLVGPLWVKGDDFSSRFRMVFCNFTTKKKRPILSSCGCGWSNLGFGKISTIGDRQSWSPQERWLSNLGSHELSLGLSDLMSWSYSCTRNIRGRAHF